MRVAVFSIVVGALDNRAHAVSGLRAADAVSALARAFSGTATLTTPTPAPTPALLTTPSGYIMPYEQIVWDSMVAANADRKDCEANCTAAAVTPALGSVCTQRTGQARCSDQERVDGFGLLGKFSTAAACAAACDNSSTCAGERRAAG